MPAGRGGGPPERLCRYVLRPAVCPRCGGRLTLLAIIDDPAVTARILRHLELSATIPEPCRPVAPAVPGVVNTTAGTVPLGTPGVSVTPLPVSSIFVSSVRVNPLDVRPARGSACPRGARRARSGLTIAPRVDIVRRIRRTAPPGGNPREDDR